MPSMTVGNVIFMYWRRILITKGLHKNIADNVCVKPGHTAFEPRLNIPLECWTQVNYNGGILNGGGVCLT